MTPYGSTEDISKQKRKLYFSVIVSPQVWGVVGDDDQLSLALTKGLQGLFVAQAILSRFHDQSQAGVDGL